MFGAGGRRFAEGDHVMALRNDYVIGILNGTRGIERNDLYGAEPDVRFREPHLDKVTLDPRRQLRAALENSVAETMAFDQHRTRTIEHDFGVGL